MDQFSLNHLSRFIGYAVLILSVFAIIDILLPMRLIDPLWQFQTMGQLVDRVPIPLIGVFLVFYGSRDKIAKWETSLVKIICWGTLLAGIGYLLLIPVGVFSSLQIDRFNYNQVKQQIAQNNTQIESLKGELEVVKTEGQMQALLNRIQGLPPEIREFQQLGESKKKLTDLINKGVDILGNQLNQNYFQKRLQLLKQSVTWGLSSLIAGVLFIVIWRITQQAMK